MPLQIYVVSDTTICMGRPEGLQPMRSVLMSMTCNTANQVDALRLGCYLKSCCGPWVLLSYGAILIWVNFTVTSNKGDVRIHDTHDGCVWVYSSTASVSMMIPWHMLWLKAWGFSWSGLQPETMLMYVGCADSEGLVHFCSPTAFRPHIFSLLTL